MLSGHAGAAVGITDFLMMPSDLVDKSMLDAPEFWWRVAKTMQVPLLLLAGQRDDAAPIDGMPDVPEGRKLTIQLFKPGGCVRRYA